MYSHNPSIRQCEVRTAQPEPPLAKEKTGRAAAAKKRSHEKGQEAAHNISPKSKGKAKRK